MNKLAKFIKERRKDEALSQVALANKIGITNVTLSKIENGEKIGSNVMRKLSAYFNIDTRQLRNLMNLDENNK